MIWPEDYRLVDFLVHIIEILPPHGYSSVYFNVISMIAAAIRLLFLHEVHYSFILYFVFGSVLLYFMSATFVFHQYRHKHQRLQIYHLGLFLGILAVFFIFNLFVGVPNIVIIAELTLFFIIYAKLTTT
nr:hypothetical protein [Peribacillus frigoritolerans]